MNADGSHQGNLTQNQADDGNASWSPDGRKIAFNSKRDGNWEIYVMNADGSDQTRLTAEPDRDWLPSWSPDGRQISFVSDRDRNFEVYVMNTDGNNQTNLTNNPAMEDSLNARPSWLPDGSAIAFESKGHARSSPTLRQILGIASILLQSGLLMGLVLLAVKRWTLPLGSLTLVLTLNTALMVTQEDEYLVWLIPAAAIAGLAADLLLHQLKPSPERLWAMRLFAFAVPVLFYGLCFLVILLTGGIGWSVHLWTGSIVLAGIVGWLLSYVLISPPISPKQGVN